MDITFKQSRNWHSEKPIEWYLENSKMIFNHSGHNGYRPHLVLKQPLNGVDLIIIDIERWGLVIKGESKFNLAWEKDITKFSDDVITFFTDFVKTSNPYLVNPKFPELKRFYEKFMGSSFVYKVQYACRKGLVLYRGKNSWNWLSIQLLNTSQRLFFWHFSTNPPYRQWFAMFGIFPLYFTKDNGSWQFGVNLIFWS